MTIAAHSVVQASPRTKVFAGAFVILYAVITILPLLWIVATAFKSQSDAIAYPPKVIFQPTLEGFVNLFTVRTRQTPDFIAKLPPPETWYDKLVRERDMVNLLTSGGPGSTTELVSITLKRAAFEKWRTGYSSALAIILFVTVFGAANIYVKALNRVKQR